MRCNALLRPSRIISGKVFMLDSYLDGDELRCTWMKMLVVTT